MLEDFESEFRTSKFWGLPPEFFNTSSMARVASIHRFLRNKNGNHATQANVEGKTRFFAPFRSLTIYRLRLVMLWNKFRASLWCIAEYSRQSLIRGP